MAVKKLNLTLDEAPRSSGLVEALASARPSSVTELLIDVLHVSADNPAARTEPGEELDRLAESIKREGILQPLLVVPDGDGQHTVLSGNRRLTAAVIAGLTSVPCTVRADLSGREVEILLAANGGTRPLSPVEEADLMARLADDGLTQVDIAQLYGVEQGQVSKRLALAKLPAEVKALVERGRVQVTDALSVKGTPNDVLVEAAGMVANDPYQSIQNAVFRVEEKLKEVEVARLGKEWTLNHGGMTFKRISNYEAAMSGRRCVGKVDDPRSNEKALLRLGKERKLALAADGRWYELSTPTPSTEEKQAAKQRKSDRDVRRELAEALEATRWPFVAQAAHTVGGADRNQIIWLVCALGGVSNWNVTQLWKQLADDDQAGPEAMVDGMTQRQLGDLAWTGCVAKCEALAREELARLSTERGARWQIRSTHLLLPAWFDLLAQMGYQIDEFEKAMLADIEAAWVDYNQDATGHDDDEEA